MKNHLQTLKDARISDAALRRQKALSRTQLACLVTSISTVLDNIVFIIGYIEGGVWGTLAHIVYASDMVSNGLGVIIVMNIWKQVFFFHELEHRDTMKASEHYSNRSNLSCRSNRSNRVLCLESSNKN